MKSFFTLLSVTLCCSFGSVANAASDSTTVGVEVIHDEYVKFIGTADGIVKTIPVADIKPANNNSPNPTVNIGTLGLEATVAGSCRLDFSSLNGFSLKHSQGNQRLASYELSYNMNTIDSSNLAMVLPSCNTASTSLDFTAVGKIKKNARPGLYSDTVTITVTTQ